MTNHSSGPQAPQEPITLLVALAREVVSMSGPTADFLSLPAVSRRTGLSLDTLRRKVATIPELASLLVSIGDRRFVRELDLPRVVELATPRR